MDELITAKSPLRDLNACQAPEKSVVSRAVLLAGVIARSDVLTGIGQMTKLMGMIASQQIAQARLWRKLKINDVGGLACQLNQLLAGISDSNLASSHARKSSDA